MTSHELQRDLVAMFCWLHTWHTQEVQAGKPNRILSGGLVLGHPALHFSTWMHIWSSELGDIYRPSGSSWFEMLKFRLTIYWKSWTEISCVHYFRQNAVFISHIAMHLNGLWRESEILSPEGGNSRICFTVSIEGSKEQKTQESNVAIITHLITEVQI